MLTAEVPSAALDRDAVGRTLARLVSVCDLLHEESASFLGDQAKLTPTMPTALLERYAAEIAELETPSDAAQPERPAADPEGPGPASADPEGPGSAGAPASPTA